MKTPQNNSTAILARGVSVNLIGKFFGRALHLIGQILLARWLGPVLFGLYAIGWNILRVASAVLPIGLDVAVLEQGGALWPDQKDKAGRVSNHALWITMPIGLVSAALLYWQAGPIADAFGKAELAAVIRLFAIALPLMMGLKVAASVTRVTRQMRYGALAEELLQPLSHLLLLGLFLLGWHLGVQGAIWAMTISFGLAFILTLSYLRRLFGVTLLPIQLDPAMARSLLKRAAPIAAAGGFTTLILLTDRLLVGFFLTEADAGLYQALSIFAVFFVTVLTAFKTIAAPMLSSASQVQDRGAMRRAYQLSTRWSLYLSIPAAAVLIAAPDAAMLALFGELYLGAGGVLIVLTLAQVANLLTGPVDHMLMMTGYSRVWTVLTALVFALNLSLNWVLIPRMGLIGAAWATLISFVATSLFAALAVWRIYHVWPYELSFAKSLLATAVMAIVVALGAGIGLGAAWIEVLWLAFLAYLSFLVTVWRLGLSSDDREALASLRSILNRAGR